MTVSLPVIHPMWGRGAQMPLLARSEPWLAEAPSVGEAIRRIAAARPAAPAILSPDRPPLSFGELSERIAAFGAQLDAADIPRSARLGLVLPNGPELALANVAAAAHG